MILYFISLILYQKLYPQKPIELVVSVGTGAYSRDLNNSRDTTGWNALVNTLVLSSTDTEDVHNTMSDFMKSKYFRFNPSLPERVSIDEISPTTVKKLKSYANDFMDSAYELIKLKSITDIIT